MPRRKRRFCECDQHTRPGPCRNEISSRSELIYYGGICAFCTVNCYPEEPNNNSEENNE